MSYPPCKRAEQRRENLRALVAASSYRAVADKLGYQRDEFIIHMAGPNPTRSVTERTAREIERVYELKEYAMDKPLSAQTVKKAVEAR